LARLAGRRDHKYLIFSFDDTAPRKIAYVGRAAECGDVFVSILLCEKPHERVKAIGIKRGEEVG